MAKHKMIEPIELELPSDFADRLGINYTQQVTNRYKKDNGQFFTPIQIARLMASFCGSGKSALRILDPGCGTAILSCAVIERIIETSHVESISLVVYETDLDLIPFTKKSLDYLKDWLGKRGIRLNYILYDRDFVLENASVLKQSHIPNLFEETKKVDTDFDYIISNPPYFKLSKDDRRTHAAQELVSGQPNIYSLFMGISAKLLVQNGELIFITPRSFASGKYFKAFRRQFFNTVNIDRVHLFNSRKDAFSRDSVLQETVIIKAVRGASVQGKTVPVSSSVGIKDVSAPKIRFFDYQELIDMNSREIIFHLPTSEKEASVLNLVSNWKCALADLDIHISTGPVVSFRAVDFIQGHRESDSTSHVPLIWLHNVAKMHLEWPKVFKEKGQYIKVEQGSRSLLVPNKNYIFLRRFSTKDDKSRLIAAPYLLEYPEFDYLGVENKVNYIYRKGGHLAKNEVIGLCALLNSELFDTYFQIFNGNVNVSATELREMRFPSLDIIKEVGNLIIGTNDYSLDHINLLVADLFEIQEVID